MQYNNDIKDGHCHNDDVLFWLSHLIQHPHEDAVVFISLQRVPDLDTQGLRAAVQGSKDHVTAPGVIIDPMPADHREAVRVGHDLLIAKGHWARSVCGRAGHEEASESVYQPHADTVSAQLELN